MVSTNARSALEEIISSGENPRRQASQNTQNSNTTVIKIFGQAFSAHCPRHVSCSIEENGFRYGMGH